MIEIMQLAPGEQMPEMPENESWVIVEASDDGRFFGTGAAFRPSGEAVFYASLAESDVSLETAMSAACNWAKNYNVPRVWVQAESEDW